MKTFLAVGAWALSAACLAGLANEEALIFDVPRLDKLKVDAESWDETGFRVDLMPDSQGNLLPASIFDPKFRLAWNEEGLRLLLSVRCASIIEAGRLDEFWSRDSFEVFMAEKPGAAAFVHVMISPGCDPAHPEVRTFFNPEIETPVPKKELRAEAACKKTPEGYQAEVLMPWKNLKLAPKSGDLLAFQLMVNKYRRPAMFNAIWFPIADTSRNSKSMHVIRLAAQPSPPAGFTATAAYERFSHIHVIAGAGEAAAGNLVSISMLGKVMSQAPLQNRDGRASAEALLPMPEPGAPPPVLEVACEGRGAKSITLPDAGKLRAETLAFEKIACDNFCFSGQAFPRCDFEHPDLVEKLIGPYTVRNLFYGSDGQPAATADKPGRYAAIIEATPAGGPAIRRFCTLFRCEEAFDSRRSKLKNTPQLPGELGLEPDVLKKHEADVNAFVTRRFGDSLAHSADSAVLLAGLHDLGLDKAAEEIGNPVLIDRQWWVNFKRKFYGLDKVHPYPIICPVKLEGKDAPVIREGSPERAGMKPDTADKLDALCSEWEKHANEPFNACVVRHGVIVFHKAYGKHEGETVTTKTRMQTASAGKFLSAILMMELADQGLINLDQTIDAYLPALRDIPCKRPPTVRDLYLHITGMPGSLGDGLNDLEEIVAAYYPSITDAKQSYQATGLALGGKIVEMLSGEAHPIFYQRHLLDPLGCKNTQPGGTSGGALTTAMDLAIIGQMTLNGGAYGQWRFMSEKSARQFAPQAGKDRIGPDKNIRWGIGTKLYDSDRFSATAFGHPGACGAFVFVDPEHDLVATMTRWDEGHDYLKYRTRFFALVWDGILDEEKAGTK